MFRVQVVGLTILVVVLAFADGVKFARQQALSDDLGYRVSRLFHHEPTWRDWFRFD